MTALRIRQAGAPRAEPPPDDPLKAYLERLVKLIPAEVVALYLAGKSLIQTAYGVDPLPPGHADFDAQKAYWLIWSIFCLLAVIAVRAWATSSPKDRIKPEWPAVAIATISFLVWVYSFGDVFRLSFDLFNSLPPWSSLAAGLLVLAWTFTVPFIYAPNKPAPAGGALRRLSEVTMRRTPPSEFTEADAEQVVLDGAQKLTNVRVGLSEKISDRFANARQMRRLVGVIQDLILRDHDIWVDLASGSDDELEELRKKTYGDLARWTHAQVHAHGRPSIQRWENLQ